MADDERTALPSDTMDIDGLKWASTGAGGLGFGFPRPLGGTGEPVGGWMPAGLLEQERADAQAWPGGLRFEDVALQCAVLEEEVFELRGELRRLREALLSQRLVVESGYLVRVYQGPEDGEFVAVCDTLQCVAGGTAPEEAIEAARGQIREMLDFLAEESIPIPLPDIQGGP